MFKGIRKFYKNNRIYCILMFISIICILGLSIGLISYFVKQNTGDPYGRRLIEVKNNDLGNALGDVEKYFKEQENVTGATVRLQGKIIYATVNVNDEVTLEAMQNIATGSLDKIEAEKKDFYDIQFLFTRKSYPAYMGSKSSANQTITWSNYNIDNEETTTTAAKK